MKPNQSDATIKHSVETNPEDVLKYWSADKMRNAKPAEMPTTDDLKRGKKRRQRPPHSSHSQQV